MSDGTPDQGQQVRMIMVGDKVEHIEQGDPRFRRVGVGFTVFTPAGADVFIAPADTVGQRGMKWAVGPSGALEIRSASDELAHLYAPGAWTEMYPTTAAL